MAHTTDASDPELGRGVDIKPTEQHKKYLVLSEEERSKGFVRPVRESYIHLTCNIETKMSLPIAETYARDNKFYGSTYCISCKQHLPVDEFVWKGTDEKVGS